MAIKSHLQTHHQRAPFPVLAEQPGGGITAAVPIGGVAEIRK